MSADYEKTPKDNEKVSILAEDDPYSLQEFTDTTAKWNELTTSGKVKRVLLDWILKPIALLLLLYLFICSLDFLSSAFRLLGGKAAGKAFAENSLLSNPVAGVIIGVLVTVLVQSSSTSTSIVITMVGAGIIFPKHAVFLIMGANIGTSVTNTIVSLGHIGDKNEFRRAFAGATVHDMFNWLTVLILLPIEVVSGYLYRLTELIVDNMNLVSNENADREILKVITKPFTKLVIQVDKKVITQIATGDEAAASKSLLKRWCEYATYFENVTVSVTNAMNVTINETQLVEKTNKSFPIQRCKAAFSYLDFSDAIVGIIMLLVALTILCTCLVLIVKLLHSMLKGKLAIVIKKTFNANIPGKMAWLTGYLSLLVGAGMTIILQSSSIFTSALVPLVGVGIVTVERIYPLTLGSNIGTTATGILASLTLSGIDLRNGLQIALCHLIFNISGILIWYPIPILRRVPIRMAKFLGNVTAKYRWFAIIYLFSLFFLMPAAVFGLSVAGIIPLFTVLAVVIFLVILIIVLNLCQKYRREKLPKAIQTWNFLPIWLRSLQPYDKGMRKVFSICPCKTCHSCKENQEFDDIENAKKPNIDLHTNGSCSSDNKASNGLANPAFSNSEDNMKFSTNL